MWDKSTFSTLYDSIKYHARKHGKMVPGKPFYATYLRKSSQFNYKGAHKVIDIEKGSTKWIRKTGEFIIKNTQNGKIVSYGWNYD